MKELKLKRLDLVTPIRIGGNPSSAQLVGSELKINGQPASLWFVEEDEVVEIRGEDNGILFLIPRDNVAVMEPLPAAAPTKK